MNDTEIPSGWYPDPDDAQRLRYWNGTQWTQHVHAPDRAPAAVIARASNLRVISILFAVLLWFPVGLPCGIAGAVMSKRARTMAEQGDQASATRQLNRVRAVLIGGAIVTAVYSVAFVVYFVAGGPS